MDYLKIQKELLDTLYKSEFSKVYIYKGETDVIFTMDNIAVFIVPKEHFYIDLNNLKCIRIKNFFNVFGLEKQAVEARRTVHLRETEVTTLVKVANENTEVWLNDKILKKFGKNIDFKITDNKSPVYIYTKNKLIGCMLPTSVSE